MDKIELWSNGIRHQEYGEDLLILLTYEGKVIKIWYRDVEKVRVHADVLQQMIPALMKQKFSRTAYKLHHIKEDLIHVVTEEAEEANG